MPKIKSNESELLCYSKFLKAVIIVLLVSNVPFQYQTPLFANIRILKDARAVDVDLSLFT